MFKDLVFTEEYVDSLVFTKPMAAKAGSTPTKKKGEGLPPNHLSLVCLAEALVLGICVHFNPASTFSIQSPCKSN
jgi:hypothetical protein